jgi:hypothetical protein
MIGVAMNKDEALKMAIEALEHAELVFYITKDDGSKVSIYAETINACKEALNIANCDLKQPAQEPVAWMDEANNTITTVQLMKYGWLGSDDRAIPDAWIKLYTHPHQWQGLTDDEIGQIIVNSKSLLAIDFYRAIEQALKEKNT